MRAVLALTLAGVATLPPVAAQTPQPASPPVGQAAALQAARAALGGNAALQSVQSFTVTGTLTRQLSSISTSSAVDMRCILPDRFVSITRRTASQGPLGTFQITEHAGFNGSDPIDVVDAPDAPVPVRIPGVVPRTPEEAAAARDAQLRREKQRFVRMILPLFAASIESYALEFFDAGRIDTPAGPMDAVGVRAQDGFEMTLLLDAATHLPARLSWQDTPIVTMSVTSTMTVGPGGRTMTPPPQPALPTGDPTAGLAPVEWSIEISDYRVQDGFNWPHRFRTTVDGQLYEDVRLRDYRINPDIDPKVFAPGRRAYLSHTAWPSRYDETAGAIASGIS